MPFSVHCQQPRPLCHYIYGGIVGQRETSGNTTCEESKEFSCRKEIRGRNLSPQELNKTLQLYTAVCDESFFIMLLMRLEYDGNVVNDDLRLKQADGTLFRGGRCLDADLRLEHESTER